MKNRLCKFLGSLTLTGTQCVYCGREIPKGESVCPSCAREEDELKNRDGFYRGGVLYAYRYGGAVRSLIHRFKYGDMPRYSIFIAQKMAEFLLDYEIDADLVTYVPIHRKRRKLRGYDQGEMIAMHLGTLLALPCEALLERTRDTRPQYKLDADERRENIRGAFGLKDGGRDLAGRNILLIDDIYTTGATVSEAMKPLMRAGASVMVYAYAKEFPRGE